VPTDGTVVPGPGVAELIGDPSGLRPTVSAKRGRDNRTRRQLGLAADQLKERCLLQHLNRSGRILDAGQFDDDLVTPLSLNNRLADAKTVDAALDRIAQTGEHISINRLPRRGPRLQHGMHATFKIKSQSGFGACLDVEEIELLTRKYNPGRENSQNDNDGKDVPRTNSH